MYDLERQNKILELLKNNKAVSVNKLAQLLYASSATIRRDLTKMEQKGLVTRTFGAVMINANPSNTEKAFELREKSNIVQKRSLCQRAVDLIRDNSSIFIDSSSTLLHIVPYLNSFSNLTIITNGLVIANELINQTKHSVIICGGQVQPNTNSMLGALAFASLRKFHTDLSLISTAALDFQSGFYELTIESSELKKVLISNSDKTVVLCDESKINKRSLYQCCDLGDVDTIISDYVLTKEDEKLINKSKVEFVNA